MDYAIVCAVCFYLLMTFGAALQYSIATLSNLP